jgi:hypothetical protein
VFSYEIRTFERRWRSSLIMFAQCPNDLAAIMVARDATRKGQAVEVWRGDRLIYRVGLRSDRTEEAAAKATPQRRNWMARIPRLRSEF